MTQYGSMRLTPKCIEDELHKITNQWRIQGYPRIEANLLFCNVFTKTQEKN